MSPKQHRRLSIHPALLFLGLGLGLGLGLAACSSDSPIEHGSEQPEDADTDSSGESEPEDGPTIICKPGEVRCADTSTIETCAPTGLKWEPSSCGEYQACDSCFTENDEGCIAACAGPCERLEDQPTSAGCSFYTVGHHWFEELLVINPDPERTATVTMYLVPRGTNVEELAEGPLELEPGESHTFEIEPDETYGESWEFPSNYRSGGIRHIASDLPVVARHSRNSKGYSSGASLLLPEHMMRGDYVVYGYPPTALFQPDFDYWWPDPNYFTVIALEHQTTVRWWPTAATAGDGLPLPFVVPGDMGKQILNRFDTIRIGSSRKLDPPICEHDLSGTVVVADKPIWLESAAREANVPACPWEGCENPASSDAACSPHQYAWSDFMMEQNLPLEYWGQVYVGAHPPLRIMPVQYVSSAFYSQMEDIGGPSMIQMTPVSRFLSRYSFATSPLGDADRRHFVQVVRAADGADVMLDGDAIVEWEPFGTWLIANIEIDEGAHRLDSTDPFGANQYGYSSTFGYRAGYAHAIGLGAEPTFIP